jgi:hypothetical protein
MKAVPKNIAVSLLSLLVSYAAAQTTAQTATMQNIDVTREGTDLRIEVKLSSPVTPSVETAIHPNRILLDFPDTICGTATKEIVNIDGLRRVRVAQHSTNPAITRVVLDLDRAHPYILKSEGNRVLLIVSPALTAGETRRVAPAAATSGTLAGIFRRRPGTATPVPQDNVAPSELPVPPPSTAAQPPVPSVNGSSNGSSSGSSNGSSGNSAAATLPPAQVPASIPPSGEERTPSTVTAEVFPPAAAATGGVPTTTEVRDTESKLEPLAPMGPSAASAPAAPASAAPAMTMTIAREDDPSLRTVFRVKYVAEGVAYLEGGRAQGLTEGMKLVVEDSNLPAIQGDSVDTSDPRVVAELEVSAVAETSAVTDIRTPKRPVKVGDRAYLSSSDAAALVQQRTLSATRQYPAVISFTEGDTLDEEARQEVPRPPLPSVNRARGRVGFDYINTISHGSTSMTSSDVGTVFRGDITRIGGTYWNLSGYWRGRLTKNSAGSQQTLQDLINRTYHLSLTYDNPNGDFVAGFGRLYLPWAPSLDTIDGGYVGGRISKGVTLGIFGGSTPDPASWDYSPDRVIGGSFINFDGGEFNAFHYSSTSGAGISMLNWRIDRPFIFFEDSLSYGRKVAVYESAQLDDPKGNAATPSPGPGLGRSFFTLRVQPHARVELNLNHNYFRDIPTFDPTLIGTGLLDKYLFQGFSAGARLEMLKQVWVYANLGRSSRTGDTKSSLNELFGLTFGRLPLLNLRADAHYARFNSSFGSGSYESFAVSRQMTESLRLEVLAGQQDFNSALTTNNRARFLTGTVETSLGLHYYLQGNFTTNRGQLSYDQFMFSLGYRFDSKRHRQ